MELKELVELNELVKLNEPRSLACSPRQGARFSFERGVACGIEAAAADRTD